MVKRLIQKGMLKNILYTFGGKIVAMVFYTALDIACARLLSPDDYAEWIFFFSILTMMFYIGWCGINTSAKVFVSKKTSKKEIAEVVRASFLLRLIASIIISILLTILSFPLAKCLGYPNKYPGLHHLCSFVGLLIFFNSFTEFFKELSMGIGNFKKLCITTILEFSGYFLYSLFFLLFLKKTIGVAAGYVCSGFTIFLFGLYSLRQITDSRLFPLKSEYYLSTIKEILKYAVPLAISGIGGMILVEMDTCMLGLLSSKSQVANYGIAKSLCGKATHINYALTVGTMTSFSIITSKNVNTKRKELLKTNHLNLLISISVAGAFLILGKTTITLLYGNIYNTAGQILKYLLPYYILYSVSTFWGTFLDFQGYSKAKSICYSSVVILNLILNFIFIPQLGAIGAAFATSLSLLPYTLLIIIIAFYALKNFE